MRLATPQDKPGAKRLEYVTTLRTRDPHRNVFHASNVRPDEIRRLLDLKADPFWLDIDSAVPEQHGLLADVFGFHSLAIEDTLNPRTRVKLEEYDGYLFVVLRAMRFDPEKPFDGRELGVKKLCLFIGPNYLVSVHAGVSSSVNLAMAQFEREPELIEQGGPARLAHLVCDAVVDEYFPILDRVDAGVDRLEHGDMDQLDHRTFDEILKIRRLAFAARRSILPQRTIFDALAHRSTALISGDARLYFRDVFDHAQRIIDSLDAYRELIANTTDSYLARSSMRMDYATKVFSAIATLVLPFFVISEFYGMNVRGLPLSSAPGAFWIIVAVEVAISGLLLLILRKRRLL